MTFLKHLSLFMKHDLKKLKRKWPSLPLLFLFPMIIVALCAVIAVSIFMPDEKDPIMVGLVDLDKSKETKMVVNLIEGSSQLGNYIKIESLTEKQAKKQIDGRLSAYVTFPEGFTESLYNGDSVTLHITGNPNKRTQSYVVKELLDSIARHIRTSQANILTINYYAKQLNIDESKRHDILFQQFTNFLLYTVGKDKIMDEEKIENSATSSPIHYYLLSGWFIVVTIWLLALYSFFTKDEESRMRERMRLYGVTLFRQLLAKIITTFAITSILAIIAFYGCMLIMDVTLYSEHYARVAVIVGLYAIIFLFVLAILETIFTGQKIRLLMQSLFTFITLLVSGALIPALYFPLYVQHLLPYSYATEAFHWLQEIIMNGRFYADYVPLTLMMVSVLFVFIGISMWKGRVTR